MRSTGREVPYDANGDQDGLAGELRETEAGDLLLERADHGELDAVDLQHLTDAGALALHRGACASFSVSSATFCRRVTSLQSMNRPGQRHQVAHRGIVLVGADDLDVFLPAPDDHAVELRHHAGGRHDARPSCSRTASTSASLTKSASTSAPVLAGGLVIGVDHVGADAADLLQDVVPAGQRDGHHQDHGGVADDHAQRRQQGANLVCAEGADAEPESFAELHEVVSRCGPVSRAAPPHAREGSSGESGEFRYRTRSSRARSRLRLDWM